MFIIQRLYSDDLSLYYILHSYKCYQLILIIEFVPEIKYALIYCSLAKLIKPF